MDKYDQRRTAKRNNLNIDTKVSEDSQQWIPVEAKDISSGGMKFQSDKAFHIGDVVWFDLRINSLVRSFQLKVKAEVVNKDHDIYGVMFKDMPDNIKIDLDELVNYSQHHFEGIIR